MGTVQCDVNDEFVFNGDFNVIKGEEFFVDGELAFPEGEEALDGTYRTLFGFGVSHNGRIYRNSNHNMRYAMRRLTGKRLVRDAVSKQLIPGYHELLFDNQEKFFASHSVFFQGLANDYEEYFDEYRGYEDEAREHHDDPHLKRLLRIKAWSELKEENRLSGISDPWVNSVLWKLKKDEWAKPGKKPRMIGDLGVAASLRGFRVTEVLKRAQSGVPVFVNGGEIFFCKTPDPVVLKEVFDKLINPPGRFYFVYFSDDSCLSIRKSDGTVDMYNLDISSCDASHGPAIFRQLTQLVPHSARTDMEQLVAQCELPLRVVSRVNPEHILVLKPTRPMLYSGSTITTGINNIANIAIGLAISEASYRGPETILKAAESAGYIVTGCLPLTNPEDLQFLKHSPVLDLNDSYQPMLNLGVLFRASGVSKGDIPGRGAIRDRAFAFQRGLLRSAYPQADFEILQRMKRTCGEGKILDNNVFNDKVKENANFKPFFAQRESIMKRYHLSDLDYEELLDFADSGYETFCNNSALSKVLNLDYGLECTDHDGAEYGYRGGY